jgi:collagenase-like PrtC family protease
MFNIESFVIPADITKNPETIAELCKQGVKSYLIVNDPCVIGCPMSNFHFTHSSLHSTDNTADGYSSYCTTYCKSVMLNKPYEIIRSSFVRPEEIDKYTAIGVNYFKIVDRNKPSWWIDRAFKAYLNRSHEGNLLDMFPLFFHETNEKAENTIYIDNSRIRNLFEKQAKECNALICQKGCFYCNSFFDVD